MAASTLPDLVIRKGHGKMAMLVSYLWLGATTLVAVFIGLLAVQLFRPRRKEENSEHHSWTLASARSGEPLAKASKPAGLEQEEEEEPHVFQFRFSFQIPEQSISSRGVPAGEDGGSSTVTSISNNYRFISDGGCRGFVEAPPQAVTLRVQESYVDSDGSVRSPPEKLDGQLESRLGSLDVSDDAVAPNEAIGNSSGALGRALERRLSLLKRSPNANSHGGVSKEFDRELRNSRLSSPEFPSVHYSAEVGPAACVTQNVHHHRDNSTGPHASDESEEIIDVKLLDEADAPAGNYRQWLSSDSESESTSDGYSVKDLSLDFDSDGFFPEEDVETDVARASSSGLDVGEDDHVEFEQESVATQLSNSPDFAGGSKPSSEGEDNNYEEFMRETPLNSIGSSGSRDPVVDVEDLCAPDHGRVDRLGVEEGESESSESREIMGTQLSDSCGSDKESVDLGIGNQNMKTSNLSNQVPSEVGTATTSDSESEHVTGKETGDVADAAEGSDELGQELSVEEMEELESLWEHDDLLDRLRVDLKKARATGLPTILEESEGLEPWKPDAPRFLREDPMEGLHKFYRSYRERMRKLDVLNRQKMYAIGFLQLKDPRKPVGASAIQVKPMIIPAIASLLSQNFRRRRRSGDGPSEELAKELRSGIELVYVGQTCLSWEFLRYQYETTRQLLGGSDPSDGGRPYDRVAEEFQQFQVLVERFLEDEPFQGPRVPNYAKNRCVLLRRLLQVPVVRGSFKGTADAGGRWRNNNGATTTTWEQLEYVMEDSIRVFWDFVRSEKDETPSMIVRGLFGGTRVDQLQDPADSDFMAEVQTNLRQKQRKLKDVLRSGNCVVKRLRKPQRDGASEDDLFFSQVDLKLVSRVVRMSSITTDQLMWCHKKLSKISFVDRRLTREPSFLLFPC